MSSPLQASRSVFWLSPFAFFERYQPSANISHPRYGARIKDRSRKPFLPESAMVSNREFEEHGRDQNLSTEPSLNEVKSAYSLQQVRSAGIPPVPEAEFKATTRLYLAFGTLAVITLMVALDGTSLSVALPVGSLPIL